MTATWKSRMIVPLVAVVAASGIVLVFAIHLIRREPPVDAKVAAAAPAFSTAASGTRDQGPAALAKGQAEANALVDGLAGSPPPAGDGVPTFDIARIEPAGEAVIAGRAQWWNYYATAKCMIARSRINPGNSPWSRPCFLQALTT